MRVPYVPCISCLDQIGSLLMTVLVKMKVKQGMDYAGHFSEYYLLTLTPQAIQRPIRHDV